MNAILNLGKYLFAIPFIVFALFHFMGAEAMAPMAFGSSLLVYFTGLCLLLAGVSIIIGKMDKLATVLLGLFLILMVVFVHLGGAMDGDQAATGNVLKDLMLAGASWLYAANIAKDNAVIG
ncbi:MAG: hypothetical protein R2787_14145 [Saprospiraceae bacterium]